jgi:hypothetical protein
MLGAAGESINRHWRLWLLLIWLAACALLVYERWHSIHWFGLGDTDDNLRMSQVRALLAGQGWFDLRQYRLGPPLGADIHWSRLVDLPIAAIKLALTPLIGGPSAEKAAAAIAPLLPLGVAMSAIAVVARRLIAPGAFALAAAILLCAHSARFMWAPLRIDHHGWQLAMLALVMVALTDPRRARGGLLLGVATALSLAIGMEMMIYLAVVGAITVLVWIRNGEEAPRLAAYGASLAGGCALAYLLFASHANRAPVCDALSPVWLSVLVAAGALSVVLAMASPKGWWWRLALAGLGGLMLAAFFVLAWPDCLGRFEGVSPEAERLWLSKVREAMPIYKHNVRTIVSTATLPVIGLLGYLVMLWRLRGHGERVLPWAALAVPAFLAAGLLFWQTRTGPAAQLLAVPGATALAWIAIAWIWKRGNFAVAAATIVGAFMLVAGLLPQYAMQLLPKPEASERQKAVNLANRRCPTLPALRPVARLPKGVVLTHVDLGPRLITVTHHDAIAGPYHRNDRQIADVMLAFRQDAAKARATVKRYGVDYVLICPNLSESTIYRAEAPRGFYMQLMRDQVPDWLEPIDLPENSPYRMWRVVN